MSTIAWSPEHGWHDGLTATLAIDEHGRIRSEVARSLEIALANYAPCPNHPGHEWHKPAGPCSCGRSHSMLDRLSS